MQISDKISFLLSFISYSLSTEIETLPPCIVPYVKDGCLRDTNSYQCFVKPIYRQRYFQCNNKSLGDVTLISRSVLFIYSPFIDVLLNSSLTGHVSLLIYPTDNGTQLDIDFRTLYQIRTSWSISLNLNVITHPIHIFLTYYAWFDGRIHCRLEKENSDHLILRIEFPSTQRYSVVNNNTKCRHLTTTGTRNIYDTLFHVDYTCPSNECSASETETTVCLSSTNCHYVGDNTLLCRIDQLRINDRFITKSSYQYDNIVITTTDTRVNTSHIFSQELLRSCLTPRLMIIVIHGRLEIPSMNSSTFLCPFGLMTEVEFWHGNCSTFKIIYNEDLQRMYETNLIMLGNFYTGAVDRLDISCRFHSPLSMQRQFRTSNIITLCFLGIVICLMCVVGWHYGRENCSFCI